MHLETTYINERIELIDGVYDSQRQTQYNELTRPFNRINGPVTSISLHRPEQLDLSMYSSSCKHSPIGLLIRDLIVKESTADTLFIPAGGKGFRLQQPLLGGLGEAVERLLAVFHFETIFDQLIYATYENLVRQGRRALGPEELPLFAPEQYARKKFAYVPFRPNIHLRWIEGIELLTGDRVLVPAQLVLMYYKYHPGEAHIGYSTSGGLAFHCDRGRAILHGLYEFIERDAINIHWYCQMPPRRVDINLVNFLATQLGVRQARLSTPYIQDIQVFLNTLDISIPVFVAVAVDRSRQERAFLAGGGAWSNRERALAQSLLEVGQSRIGLKFYKISGPGSIRADSPPSEMDDFIDAEVYFGFAKNLPRFFWYTASEKVVQWEAVPTFSFDNEADEYESMMAWLRMSSLNPIVLDFSGACWPGAYVIKVFIPQLTQASVPSYPYLGHARFYNLPHQLGITDRKLRFYDLNPDPMPFP